MQIISQNHPSTKSDNSTGCSNTIWTLLSHYHEIGRQKNGKCRPSHAEASEDKNCFPPCRIVKYNQLHTQEEFLFLMNLMIRCAYSHRLKKFFTFLWFFLTNKTTKKFYFVKALDSKINECKLSICVSAVVEKRNVTYCGKKRNYSFA